GFRALLRGAPAMVAITNEGLLTIIDRIYESTERPELWPKTIYAIGEFLGGRRQFLGLDPGTEKRGGNLKGKTNPFEVGCYGTFFLSRTDLEALDQYAEEFGELIVRFLKIVFLSILRSQHDVAAREAIGLKIARQYLQASELSEGISVSSVSRSAARKLITALWEDGRVFSGENLRSMRLLAPHLDRSLRLQMRFS